MARYDQSRDIPLPGNISPITNWDFILQLFRLKGGSISSDEAEQTFFPWALFRALTLSFLLLFDGTSSVSVDMVEHECSLCSLNSKHRHVHSACRFWAYVFTNLMQCPMLLGLPSVPIPTFNCSCEAPSAMPSGKY